MNFLKRSGINFRDLTRLGPPDLSSEMAVGFSVAESAKQEFLMVRQRKHCSQLFQVFLSLFFNCYDICV
jgi:hypothetical protein